MISQYRRSTNRKWALLLGCLLPLAQAHGQSLCEPFYIIDRSNKDKVWEAAFNECVDCLLPVIRVDEAPQLRARLICSRKISKITHKDLRGNTAKTEFFDKNGYTFYVGEAGDTITGDYYVNVFNSRHLLTKTTCQSGFSITGMPGLRPGIYKNIEKYGYDNAGRLIKRKDITTNLGPLLLARWKRLKSAKRRKFLHHVFPQRIAYDNKGNVILLKLDKGGSKETFAYSPGNLLIKAIDLSPGVMNAETNDFLYDKGRLTTISVSHHDESPGYPIKLIYQEDNLITRYTKYHPDGSVSRTITYAYEAGRLNEIADIYPTTDGKSVEKVSYNPQGLIDKIELFHGAELVDSIGYSYEFF